jgi:hypothetical protein
MASRHSTCGPDRATKKPDVEQDHDFCGGCCGACCGSGEHLRAILYPFQRADSKSLPAELLREQELLRDIAQKHCATGAAAREVWFRSTEHCDFAFCGCVHRPVSSRENLVGFLEPRLHGAFAAAARAHLHSSHLIRRA